MIGRATLVGLLLAAGIGLPALAGNGTAAGCAPGLAGKAVPCVPPGQAAKWQIGARLPISTPWYEVRDWKRYGLTEPEDGSRYVRVDNDILRVAIISGLVLEVLGVVN